MPLRHGSKIYCQLLLDANRYKLAEQLAAAEGKKVTGMLREMVYAALEKAQPPNTRRLLLLTKRFGESR